MLYLEENDVFNYRPIAFYFITTRDPKEISYESFYSELSLIKKDGYGGIVVFNRAGAGFDKEHYFTESWFIMLDNCIRACAELGLRVWINDDYQAPPGDIGGRLEKIAPHLKQKRISLDENGKVLVKEVNWGFPAYEIKESALLFQELVYEEYKRRFGKYFGNCIVGMFSDSDARRVNSETYFGNTEMLDYFPWSDDFKESFYEEYGYDITEYLPSVIRRENLSQCRDYWEHSGKLYMGWFKSNYEWCKENGLKYTFHTSDTAPFRIEDSPLNSAFYEGKAIDAGSYCDFPGTDHETFLLRGGHNPWRIRGLETCIYGGDDSRRRQDIFYDVYCDIRAKQAQSSAYLYDKKGVMCEMYAMTGWGVSYKDLRNILSWQLMQGVTFIVQHAYHHRLHGVSKHFAPLCFSKHTHTAFAMKEFNNEAAKCSYLCSQGKLKVDIAVLDPTDFVWQGKGNCVTELMLCKMLNHYPQGYIISDIKGLRRKANELKAVINPGLPLAEEERSEIKSLGLKLYEADEVEKMLSDLPTDISWNGNGELMYMRRMLDNENEMLIVGNIETDDTLTGQLTIGNQIYEIELASGEMAFFGSGFDSYRTVQNDVVRHYLPEKTKVKFEKKNIIPLVRWENEEGRPFVLTPPDRRIGWAISCGFTKPTFEEVGNLPVAKTPIMPFKVTDDIEDAELLVPEVFMKYTNGLYIDETPLYSPEIVKIFDDNYFSYRLNVKKGAHEIKLGLIEEVKTVDHLFLRGHFDVKVINKENGKLHNSAVYYMSEAYIADECEIILSKRRDELSLTQSWTEQGQPFYSGSVRYSFDVEVPNELKNPVLVLPEVRDAAKVYADEELVEEKVFTPYRFELKKTGNVHIDIDICNTLGNMLDAYKLTSGIIEKAYITEF